MNRLYEAGNAVERIADSDTLNIRRRSNSPLVPLSNSSQAQHLATSNANVSEEFLGLDAQHRPQASRQRSRKHDSLLSRPGDADESCSGQVHVENRAATSNKRQRRLSDSVDRNSNDISKIAESSESYRHIVPSPPYTRPRAHISAPISKFNLNIQRSAPQTQDWDVDNSPLLRQVSAQNIERSQGEDLRVIPNRQAEVPLETKDKAKLSELTSQLRSLSDDLDHIRRDDTEALAKATASVTKTTELLVNSRAIIDSLSTRKTQELNSLSPPHESNHVRKSQITQQPSPGEDDQYAVFNTGATPSPNTGWDSDSCLSTDPVSFITTKSKILGRENNIDNDNSDTESDTKSVKSLSSISSRPSLSSHSSFGTAQDVGDAGHELIALLLQDATLKPLYRIAIEKLGIDNFTKLLRASAAHLSTEAQLTHEKNAAQFVKKRARYVTVCISKHLESNKDENTSTPENRHIGFFDEGSDSDGSESDIAENSHARTLGSVNSFILESSALVNLGDKLRFFVTGSIEDSLKSSVVPEHPATTFEKMADKARDDVSLVEGASVSPIDQFTDYIEDSFQLIWKEATSTASSILHMIAKVGRAIAEFLEVKEELLRPGFRRVRWTCVCGARLYDDFRQITPGSLTELEAFLNDTRARQYTNGISPTGDLNRNFPSTIATSNSSVQSIQPALSDTPSGNTPPRGLRWRGQGRDQNRQENGVTNKTWVLPIFQYDRLGTKVLHLPVDMRMSDETLFTTIKQQYLKQTSRIRRFFALRGVKKISYVKFVHALREPDIHRFDDWPLQKHSPPWIYKGCPAKKKHIPLVGHRYLMHLWQNPSHTDMQTYRSRCSRLGKLVDCLREIASYSKARSAKFLPTDRPTADSVHTHPTSELPRLPDNQQGAEQPGRKTPTVATPNNPPSEHEQNPRSSYVLLRTPKKLGDQLLPDDEDPPEAWGLYFEEGFRVHHFLIVLLFLYVLASLAFAVYWCVEYGFVGPDSGASAFGVASWMIAAVSLAVTVWFKWAD